MSRLRSWFSGKGSKTPKHQGPSVPTRPTPTAPHFVVGDVHGCLALLEAALEQIDHVIGNLGLADPKLVFVGDYVDRGPSSAAVLRRLHELNTEFPNNVICLLGNHEQMLLDFIDAPAARFKRWFNNGAASTLASFGIDLPDEPEWQDAAVQIGPHLQQALGADLEQWLRACPLSTQSGNLTVVHAGTDPGRDMSDQSSRVLLWGHPEFLSRSRSDGVWVAHGHTVMDNPVVGDGRISVDTGAYQTGLLTVAVVLTDGTVEFLQTLPQ